MTQNNSQEKPQAPSTAPATTSSDSNKLKQLPIFSESLEEVLQIYLSVAEMFQEHLSKYKQEESKKEDKVAEASKKESNAQITKTYFAKLEKFLNALKKQYALHLHNIAPIKIRNELLITNIIRDSDSEHYKSFMILKRTYEKLYSFNIVAKEYWFEIVKIERHLKQKDKRYEVLVNLENENFKQSQLLLKSSDFFLSCLYDYLNIQTLRKVDENGSYSSVASFNKERKYSIADMITKIPQPLLQTSKTQLFSLDDIANYKKKKAKQPYKNYIPHPELKNFLSALQPRQDLKTSCLTLTLYGTHEWNRSMEYRFEIKIKELHNCLQEFERYCYHINWDPDKLLKMEYQPKRAQEIRKESPPSQQAYREMVFSLLNDLSKLVSEHDFPNVGISEVFLYHCGAPLLYNLLWNELHMRGLGEAFYVYKDGQVKHFYPETFIKKIFMDWHTQHFAQVNKTQLDSYLLYLRLQKALRYKFYSLWQELIDLQKKEAPRLRQREIDSWLQKNQERILGWRRQKILERFNIRPILTLPFEGKSRRIKHRLF